MATGESSRLQGTDEVQPANTFVIHYMMWFSITGRLFVHTVQMCAPPPLLLGCRL